MKVRGVDREIQKAFGVIFACLSTRTLHLEVCSDAITDKFLLEFRRFVARRGAPQSILSDNAKQFILADRLLKEQFRIIILGDRVQDYSTRIGTTWKFITERAPWRGAVYECLIGLVKSCLKRTISRRLLLIEELSTILTEVELVVKMRPLAQAPEDSTEPVIRPIDLIRPFARDGSFMDRDESSKQQSI